MEITLFFYLFLKPSIKNNYFDGIIHERVSPPFTENNNFFPNIFLLFFWGLKWSTFYFSSYSTKTFDVRWEVEQLRNASSLVSDGSFKVQNKYWVQKKCWVKNNGVEEILNPKNDLGQKFWVWNNFCQKKILKENFDHTFWVWKNSMQKKTFKKEIFV